MQYANNRDYAGIKKELAELNEFQNHIDKLIAQGETPITMSQWVSERIAKLQRLEDKLDTAVFELTFGAKNKRTAQESGMPKNKIPNPKVNYRLKAMQLKLFENPKCRECGIQISMWRYSHYGICETCDNVNRLDDNNTVQEMPMI